jgi:hypothetical protein
MGQSFLKLEAEFTTTQGSADRAELLRVQQRRSFPVADCGDFPGSVKATLERGKVLAFWMLQRCQRS